jgi:hypothetical protein
MRLVAKPAIEAEEDHLHRIETQLGFDPKIGIESCIHLRSGPAE